MLTFLIWCVLFVVCWPLALLALILWPVFWLISLPLRLARHHVRSGIRAAARGATAAGALVRLSRRRRATPEVTRACAKAATAAGEANARCGYWLAARLRSIAIPRLRR